MGAMFPPLTPGDRIHVIAAGYGISKDRVAGLAAYISAKGYTPVVASDLVGEDMLCANSDAIRARIILDALRDPQCCAIWCMKGGYGAARLLAQLEKDAPQEVTPRAFIGYSDNTVLHQFFHQRYGWATVHGPVLWEAANQRVDTTSENLVLELLSGQTKKLSFTLTPLNKAARAGETISGALCGGNLSLVQTLVGTPHAIRTRNRIVVLEDIDEPPYRVDRVFTQLIQAGLFDKARAVLLGDFTRVKLEYDDALLEQVLARIADEIASPVYRVARVGHGKANDPLLLNARGKISHASGASTLVIPVRYGSAT